MGDCSGLIQIYLYKDAKPCNRKAIEFPLTEEGVEKAIIKQRRFLIEEMERLAVDPLVVPYPSEEDRSEGYLIVPKWIIDKLVAQNYAIRDHLSRSTIISVFEAMQRSGFLEYADSEGNSHEFPTERRKEDE